MTHYSRINPYHPSPEETLPEYLSYFCGVSAEFAEQVVQAMNHTNPAQYLHQITGISSPFEARQILDRMEPYIRAWNKYQENPSI